MDKGHKRVAADLSPALESACADGPTKGRFRRQGAQFASGGTALLALAYLDPDETLEGWTDTGHLQSSENGWIEVILP